MLRVSLNPGRIFKVQLGIIALLAALSMGGQISKYWLGHPSIMGLVPLFDLDIEANVPTYFSSMGLLACSVVLFVIARVKRETNERSLRHWVFLGAVFAVLSLDEIASIHELVISRMVEKVVGGRLPGAFHFTWVVPGIAAVAAFVAAYVPFLLRLPLGDRVRFVVSGAVYVAGAIGIEMLGARWASVHAKTGMTYAVLTNSEEVLEMLGVALFLNALLRHLRDASGGAVGLSLTFTGAPGTEGGGRAPKDAAPAPGQEPRAALVTSAASVAGTTP